MSDQHYSELNQRIHSLEELRPTINDLKVRVSKLERALYQVEQLETQLARVKDLESEHHAAHDGRTQVPAQVSEIVRNLENPLHGIRRAFSCLKCGTKNRVAVQIKCTHCDTSSWLGWWPERRPKTPPAHASNGASAPDTTRYLRSDL